jgi:hypothetical protein
MAKQSTTSPPKRIRRPKVEAPGQPTTHRKLTYEIQQKTFGPFPDLYLLDVSVGFWVTTLVPLSSRSVCSFFGSMARVRFWKTIEFLLNPSEGFRSGRVE